jgi:hypothetical protein
LQGGFANIECHSNVLNRRYWPLSKFFIPFHLKFEMPFYMKVVSLNMLDNFLKGGFLSV